VEPDNLEIWNKVSRPPLNMLKEIKGGRLSGMTDIDPMWRYQELTRLFGPIGKGWTYRVVRTWKEDYANGEVMAHAEVSLEINDYKPIPGIGGHRLATKEIKGLHYSDEGYKMAITDALSVALKMLGFAADIYMGKFDGSKYIDAPAASDGSKTSKEKTKNFKFLKAMADAKKMVGDEDYYNILSENLYGHADGITDRGEQERIYALLADKAGGK